MPEPSVRSLFTTVVVDEERIGSEFLALRDSPVHGRTRDVIDAAFNQFDDVDGNFVEQFQTTGFSARLWELYLNQALIDLGCRVTRRGCAADFLVDSSQGRFAVEAVTANATANAEKVVTAIDSADRHDQLAIRLGSPLLSKLRKRYWEKLCDTPLVFAIAPFFDAKSHAFSGAGVERYLYGTSYKVGVFTTEGVTGLPSPIAQHSVGRKVIPSNFFTGHADAKNVGAIVYSNSGGLGKFSRMAVQATPAGNARLMRRGLCHDPSPSALEPLEFAYEVGNGAFVETWAHGLHVFHNPMPTLPLACGVLGKDAFEVFYEDGKRWAHCPEFHVYRSETAWFDA